MKRVTARCLAAGIAVLVLLAGASSALAFSVQSVTVTPRAPVAGEPTFGFPAALHLLDDPLQSGGHPVVDIVTTFNATSPTDSVRDFVQHLGPGIVSNPHATPFCSRADFEGAGDDQPANCAAATPTNSGNQIGTTAVTVQTAGGPATLPGIIYNLTPGPGEAATLGVDLNGGALGHIKSLVAVTIDGHDLGLNSTSHFTPAAPILSIKLTLWGYENTGVANPPIIPNFTNPTACTESTVTVTAKSFTEQASTASGSYTPNHCDTAPFDDPADPGKVTMTVNPTSADTPAEVAVTVAPSPIFVPRVGSYVKRTETVLPPGMFLNPTRPDGIEICSPQQFNRADGTVAAACPDSSQVGSASFVSAALGEFAGKVFLAAGGGGDTIKLYVDVPLSPDAHVKLLGHVRPDLTTGQVTTVFDELPQTEFLTFKLTFFGGPHSSLTTPAACGTGNLTGVLTPFSGGAPVTTAFPYTTSFDGLGAACPGLFRPAFVVGLSNPTGGQTTSYSLTFSRQDRDKLIDTASFTLPPGLVGNLALPGLTQCPLADAANAACPESSRVGTATVDVGSGPAPVKIPSGQAFLTTPVQPGDPAGLSILVPAKVGQIDLGRTIVTVRLALRPDGGLTATTSSLPLFVQGVPTSIRASSVTIDRPGFMVTPTHCGAQPYTASFNAVGGGSASASFSGNLSGCEKLAFNPKLAATVGGKGQTKRGRHPAISTVLTQGKGQANPRTVRVVLPSAMSTNLGALNAACTQAAFDAGHCGSRATAGTASAVSPLLKAKLTGKAYFVKVGAGKLPKMVVALRGPVSIDVTGTLNVARNGQLTTTITAPDLPVSRFALTVHGGRGGVLIANRNLCTPKRLFTRVQSVGQNGKKTTQKVRTRVTGCPKPKPKKKHHKGH